MNCTKHPNRVAVAQCTHCGAGICEECAEATEYTRQECGTLCIDCYCNELAETAEAQAKRNKKRLTRIILSCISYALGLIIAICGISEIAEGGSDGPIFIALGIVLCGIYTGLTWKNAAQDKFDREERENGATYVITDDGIYKKDAFWLKIVYFIIGAVLGVVITPVRVIIDSVTHKKTKAYIKHLQTRINTARQL